MMGRIAPSTQAEAYTPQGLNPLARGPSVIIFDSSKTAVAREPVVTQRPAGTAAGSTPPVTSAALGEGYGVVPANPRYQRIMQIQNAFLKDDGRLVWQKLGGRDRAGYFVTLGLTLVGSVLTFSLLYKMSFPQQNED